MRAVAVIVLSVVTSVLFAFPPDVAVADCRDRISLSPTPDGEEFAATGRAAIQSIDSPARQSFRVEVGVDVPDGTLLYVFANGQPAGLMSIALGVGTLDLSNAGGEPFPIEVDPVCSLGPIWVTDAGGTTLLEGSF